MESLVLPAPLLDLAALNKPKKHDPVMEKLLEKAKLFEGDMTSEVSKKYKLTEVKNPDCLKEADATGIKPEENLENKTQCFKCERFILNDEMQSHTNSHSSQVKRLKYIYISEFNRIFIDL